MLENPREKMHFTKSPFPRTVNSCRWDQSFDFDEHCVAILILQTCFWWPMLAAIAQELARRGKKQPTWINAVQKKKKQKKRGAAAHKQTGAKRAKLSQEARN